MTSIKKHIENLENNGITFLNNQLSTSECNLYKKKFKKIIDNFKSKKIPINPECLMIRNPYRHDLSLSKLIYNKTIDLILSELIGPDHILVNSTIINRRLTRDVSIKSSNMGNDWHTDSHYLNGKRLEKGMTFVVITLFDDFTKKNGGTIYLPKSHKKRSIPNRNGNYEKNSKIIQAKAGSIVIIDGGVWHKGGNPANEDRWSMFSYYAPWFIKPYFRFPEMLGKEFGKKTNKYLKRLFHYNSTPPLNEEDSIYTLRY
jgi:hypothetical protein